MRMLWKIAAIDPETIIRDRSVTFTSDAGTEVPPPKARDGDSGTRRATDEKRSKNIVREGE